MATLKSAFFFEGNIDQFDPNKLIISIRKGQQYPDGIYHYVTVRYGDVMTRPCFSFHMGLDSEPVYYSSIFSYSSKLNARDPDAYLKQDKLPFKVKVLKINTVNDAIYNVCATIYNTLVEKGHIDSSEVSFESVMEHTLTNIMRPCIIADDKYDIKKKTEYEEKWKDHFDYQLIANAKSMFGEGEKNSSKPPVISVVSTNGKVKKLVDIDAASYLSSILKHKDKQDAKQYFKGSCIFEFRPQFVLPEGDLLIDYSNNRKLKTNVITPKLFKIYLQMTHAMIYEGGGNAVTDTSSPYDMMPSVNTDAPTKANNMTTDLPDHIHDAAPDYDEDVVAATVSTTMSTKVNAKSRPII